MFFYFYDAHLYWFCKVSTIYTTFIPCFRTREGGFPFLPAESPPKIPQLKLIPTLSATRAGNSFLSFTMFQGIPPGIFSACQMCPSHFSDCRLSRQADYSFYLYPTEFPYCTCFFGLSFPNPHLYVHQTRSPLSRIGRGGRLIS